MSLRSPFGRVRGLGSAKEGVSHFVHQRLTAIALIPLLLWFVISVISLVHGDYQQFRHWISVPGNTALFVVLVFAVFYHAALGLQVVIEDYVHCECVKIASLIAVKFGALLLGVFSALAIVRVAFVGG